MAALSAGPLVSTQSGTPLAFKWFNSALKSTSDSPGGRLPATTTAWGGVALESSVFSVSISACKCVASMGMPGPLISVTRPLCSAILALIRVSPGTRTKASVREYWVNAN